jgi:hypothetical protein
MKQKSKKGSNRHQKRSLMKTNIIRAKFSDICLDYEFESKPVGTGGFGSVYKAVHRQTNQIRAIKHIQLKQNLATTDASCKSIKSVLIKSQHSD